MSYKPYNKQLQRIRQKVFERQNGECILCNCAMCYPRKMVYPVPDNLYTVHHVIPVREGGKWELTNLVGICRKCHDELEIRIKRIRERYKRMVVYYA